MTGAAYEEFDASDSDAWPPTLAIHKWFRPVPGAVKHVMATWAMDTAQSVAVNSRPVRPYVTRTLHDAIDQPADVAGPNCSPLSTTVCPPAVTAACAPGPLTSATTGTAYEVRVAEGAEA